MLERPMDVLNSYPIRRTDEQKTAFISALTEFVSNLGYPVNVEQDSNNRNVVIGDPNNARYLITAHYDTPVSSMFPNLLLPKSFALFYLYQISIILAYMLIALVVCAPVWLLTQNKTATFLVWYITYMVQAMWGRIGKPNKNNFNDNTSGVVTLLETVVALPQELRDRVCFVLFDQEEKGLVGSKIYRKAHKEQTDKQIVLNLDCVGDGDILQFEPVKSIQNDTEFLNEISAVCTVVGNKELRLAKGPFTGSSDQRSFPKAVGIKALHYKKGIGLYCGHIHTNRDKTLDETNVNILRSALIRIISSADKKG